MHGVQEHEVNRHGDKQHNDDRHIAAAYILFYCDTYLHSRANFPTATTIRTHTREKSAEYSR